MGKTDALIALHSHLVKGGREDYAQVIPAKYAKLSAVDVYNRFVGVRMEAKGMMASGFGASGFGLSFGVGIDLGDFVLPGLLSIPIDLEAGAEAKNHALLIIHRTMPHSLLDQLAGTGSSASWYSPTPTCFMTLFGRSYTIKLTARSGIYIFQEPVALPEDGAAGKALSLTELPLTLNAGAAIEAEYTYQAMKAYDWAPGWYCCEQEETLVKDFRDIIQTIDKIDLKTAIRGWISNFERVYDWSAAVKRISQQKAGQLTLQDVWDDYLNVQLKEHGRVSRVQRVKERVKRTYTSVAAGSPIDPTLLGKKLSSVWDDALSHSTRSVDLQTRLAAIINIIPPEAYIDTFAPKRTSATDSGILANIKQETGPIRSQAIEFYYRLGEAVEKALSGLPPSAVPPKGGALAELGGTPWWYLAFLTISSHAVGGGAAASATPMVASLTGKVSGRIKRTAYRYQTYALDEARVNTLVYTQDTAITYRQAGVEAQAVADLVVLQPGRSYARSPKNSKFVANGLTYRSVAVYWLYPSIENQSTVLTQVGSGLSYGVSVNSADLLAMLLGIEQITSAAQQEVELKLTPHYARMLKTLAGYLRMSSKSLGEFLAAIPAAKKAMWATMESLLIEASYSFKPTNWVTTWKSQGGFSVCHLDGLWNYDPIAYCDTFDAIRIRCRMADHRESKHSFRLEASYVATFGITLSRIGEAGSESVLDLHTQFYNGKNYETAVPPVALFHQ